jgi:hypothetical protein
VSCQQAATSRHYCGSRISSIICHSSSTSSSSFTV